MSDFTAIDFETAQGYRWSICQIGLVRVIGGQIAETRSILVQPPNNYYWPSFSAIHGLSARDTANAPTFDRVWPEILPFIANQIIVAHNAAFDLSCLRQTLGYYGHSVPAFTSACTYRLYRLGLARLCAAQGIALDHHNALSDAKACAELYLRHLGGLLRHA